MLFFIFWAFWSSSVFGATFAENELRLNATALRRILYPASLPSAQQLEICTNLLRYNSFRNKVGAYHGTPEDIALHNYQAYVIQTLPDGTLQTDIPQNGHDVFVDLKISFFNSIYPQEASPGQDTAINYGINNPVFGWSYQSRQGLFPPGTEVFLVLWHGAGGSISHAGSVLPLMRSLMNPKVSNYKKTMAAINETGTGRFAPAKISAEAFDFPFCGNHCDTFSPYQADLAQTLAHLADYFKTRRAQAIEALGHDIPIVVLARSAAAGVLTALSQAYPELINGHILVGPTAPGMGDDDLGYQDSLNHLIEEIRDGQSKPNYPSIIYMDSLYQQMTAWKKSPDPFRGINTLVLVGEDDLETPGTATQDGKLIPTQTRAWLLEKAAQHLPHLYFYLIPHGRHDVFSRYKGQENYDNITPLADVQLFLKAQVEAFKAAQTTEQNQSFE
ncbi:MAG: hypothetical protein J6Y94_08405 [Bacteriovoracaceae bacterium]|nr:hypothetical protein [Bacteriovoracaceae bacterium]